MGGYNRAGQLELFDKSKYVQWRKENFLSRPGAACVRQQSQRNIEWKRLFSSLYRYSLL